MDSYQLFILATTLLLILLFWRMGVWKRLYESIQYIRKFGWVEYKAARKRYDEHMKAEKARVSKRDKIKADQAARRRK